MKKLYAKSNENIKLRKKLAAYKKTDQKNESVVLVEDFPEEDWETTSEKSVVDNSLNMSPSPKSNNKNENNKISIGINTSPSNINQTPNPKSPVTNPPVNQPQICKFHAPRRCHFGNRCRNIHLPDQKVNSNHPWTTVLYKTRPGFIPRLTAQNYYNPFTPNRFQSLESPESLGVNVGGYWSVPHIQENESFNRLPNVPVNGVRLFYSH